MVFLFNLRGYWFGENVSIKKHTTLVLGWSKSILHARIRVIVKKKVSTYTKYRVILSAINIHIGHSYIILLCVGTE